MSAVSAFPPPGRRGKGRRGPPPRWLPRPPAPKAPARRSPHTLTSFFKIPRSIFGDFQTTIFIGRLLSTLAQHVPRGTFAIRGGQGRASRAGFRAFANISRQTGALLERPSAAAAGEAAANQQKGNQEHQHADRKHRRDQNSRAQGHGEDSQQPDAPAAVAAAAPISTAHGLTPPFPLFQYIRPVCPW